MLERDSIKVLEIALAKMEEGFGSLESKKDDSLYAEMLPVIMQVAEKMQDNYPYFHPGYAGQMLKPPHPIAKAAYMLAMWINPNNHALDGGKASSAMEKEVVNEIAENIPGWKESLGHLTGGGTMANLEALWICGETGKGKKILASETAHYTHQRISSVLKLNFEKVVANTKGVMDLDYLEDQLKLGSVGAVVATLGATGTGAVDELKEIINFKFKYGFRVHVDAAYGGYFKLIDNLREDTKENFDFIEHADSFVIDPHKHGLQPYGCGCVIFKDASVGKYYKHESPYTYFTSDDLHLGEISLECSRAGASAAALWATHKLFPPVREGRFAKELEKCRNAALSFYERLKASDKYNVFLEPELDIVNWFPKGDSVKEISSKSKYIFDAMEKENIYLAMMSYPVRLLDYDFTNTEINSDNMTVLRSVMMKPEHIDYEEKIFKKMNEIL